MSTIATAANGGCRYGHHRWTVAIIIMTKKDMTKVWNEDW
jgi:hypothetical protein